MVKEVQTAAQLDAEFKAAGDKLIVIDFFANWCGPCKAIAPFVHEKEEALAGKVVFLKVDVDVSDEVVGRFGIDSMPTFVFVKKSAEVKRFSGASKQNLEKYIAELQ
eukprot:TRINITY_DN1719_c0_g1_i1.p2 TRINITY_DN1719_c0_g1~~TRINITY_DN1719_c0_g1_i1.p2  ORF type:complete len:107 (-),score=33.95 TRINITY_DN1719_c0_g1_i1:43-363(-)